MNTNNSAAIVLGAIAVSLIVAATAISGCSIGDVVKSPIPATVRNDPEVQGLPPVPSHNESIAAFALWSAARAAESDQWRRNLQASGEVIGAVQAFGNTAIESLSPALAGLPFGGLAIAGLSFASGLFLRKPGTQGVIDAAYEDGLKAGREAVAQGVRAVASKDSA